MATHQKHAVVVPGEASETDEEEDIQILGVSNAQSAGPSVDGRGQKTVDRKATGPLQRAKSEVGQKGQKSDDGGSGGTQSNKHQSALHFVLRDDMLALQADSLAVGNRRCQAVSGKELASVTQLAGDTRQTMQDVCYKVRAAADILYKVESEIDILLCSADLLPNLRPEQVANTPELTASDSK